MEVALQENLKYQLELLQFGFIQQQQSYLPLIPSPFYYHNFTMAAGTEESTMKSETMSPNGDSMPQIALAAGTAAAVLPPTVKPPRVVVRCEVCDLSFSSPSVYDSHMAGSKHQKKVKSAELLKSMESMNHEFERNEISGVIRCIVCDITVNSPQLLATHMAGNKHRANAQKRSRQEDGTSGPPAKRPCVDGEDPSEAAAADPADALGAKKKKKKKKKSTPEAAAGTEGTAPEDFKLPDFVSKLESEHGCYYFCNTCNAHCNSQHQLSQHLSSKRHGDKMRELSGDSPARGRRGRGNFKGGPWGSSEGPDGSAPFRGRGRGIRGDRSRGFFGNMRGRGVRGFYPGRGRMFTNRGRGGEDARFRGSSRGPFRGALRGSFRGGPGFPAPWGDFRGRGRGRGRAGAPNVGSGFQAEAEWGEENWPPTTHVDGSESGSNCAPNEWHESTGYDNQAGYGVKRSHNDSGADNYPDHNWTGKFIEAGVIEWGNTSADEGIETPGSHGGRASAVPRRSWRGGYGDSRGGNCSSENYFRGEGVREDPSKSASDNARNYGGFNYTASSSNDYLAEGSNNYDAGTSNQYEESTSNFTSNSYVTSGGPSSYSVGVSSHADDDSSSHAVDGSRSFSTNTSRGRGRGSASGDWYSSDHVSDSHTAQFYTAD